MPTIFTRRVILIVPVGAKLTAVVNWLVANVDATESESTWPLLSATGIAPATHAWRNRADTDSDARQLLFRLCNLAGVTPPSGATWAGWTSAQKRSWLAGIRDTLKANYGIGVFLANNDGAWDAPEAALAYMGLQTIGGVP